MPRLSKQEREEWSLFISPETGRITFHPLCRSCVHNCQQTYKAELCRCPRRVSKRSVARAQKRQNTTE